MNTPIAWILFIMAIIGLIFALGCTAGDITGRSSEQDTLASALCYPEIVISQKFPIGTSASRGLPRSVPIEYTIVTCAKSVVTITNEGVYSRVAK